MGVIIKRSTADRAREIAVKRGIPIVTVETVIKDLLESYTESALNHERIVIDGLQSITVVYDHETEDYVPRGRVSPVLKHRLQQNKNKE